MNAFCHLQFAARSDLGRKRKNNEDAFGVFPANGIFCVSDGMGGGEDGEVASAATVKAIEDFCMRHKLPDGRTYDIDDLVSGLRASANDASNRIFRRSREMLQKGCGATFVGICFDASNPSEAVVLHAGDSRLYLIRKHGIMQVTKDHSAAELIGVKDEKDVNPMFRGMIMRAVGLQQSVELERTAVAVQEGDRILICSDGLNRMVPDKKLLSVAKANVDIQAAADALVAEANSAGGVDNITIVLIDVGRLPVPLPALPLHDADISRAQAHRDKSDLDDNDSASAAGCSTSEPATSGTSQSRDTTLTTDAVSTAETFEESAPWPEANRNSTMDAMSTATQETRKALHRRRFCPWLLLSIGASVILVACVSVGIMRKRGKNIHAANVADRQAEQTKVVVEAAYAAESIAADGKGHGHKHETTTGNTANVVGSGRVQDKRQVDDRRFEPKSTMSCNVKPKGASQDLAEDVRRDADEAQRRAEFEHAAAEITRRKECGTAECDPAIGTNRKMAPVCGAAMSMKTHGTSAGESGQEKNVHEGVKGEEKVSQIDDVGREKKEAASCREAAWAMLREASAQEPASSFVKAVVGSPEAPLGKVPDTIFANFRQMRNGQDCARTAEAIVCDVRKAVESLLPYVKDLLKLDDNDSLPEKERSRRIERDGRYEKFLEKAEMLCNGDPRDVNVQMVCAEIISELPGWLVR